MACPYGFNRDSTTTDHAFISLISTWRRKKGDIFHKKSTMYIQPPTPFHRIYYRSMCHCNFSTSLSKYSSRPHHTGLTGQLCFILNMVSPSRPLRWLLYASKSPHQSNNFSTASFHLAVLTYELQPPRSFSENAEVPTHLHNVIIYAKQGLLSSQCVCGHTGELCI